jgi:hypothetical protein
MGKASKPFVLPQNWFRAEAYGQSWHSCQSGVFVQRLTQNRWPATGRRGRMTGMKQGLFDVMQDNQTKQR